MKTLKKLFIFLIVALIIFRGIMVYTTNDLINFKLLSSITCPSHGLILTLILSITTKNVNTNPRKILTFLIIIYIIYLLILVYVLYEYWSTA